MYISVNKFITQTECAKIIEEEQGYVLWYQIVFYRQKAHPHQLIYSNGCENVYSD